MEALHVEFDNARYDSIVHAGPPEAGDMELVVKDGATAGGWPGVVVTFTVQLPNGQHQRVQAVTTARLFLGAATLLRGHVAALGLDLSSPN